MKTWASIFQGSKGLVLFLHCSSVGARRAPASPTFIWKFQTSTVCYIKNTFFLKKISQTFYWTIHFFLAYLEWKIFSLEFPCWEKGRFGWKNCLSFHLSIWVHWSILSNFTDNSLIKVSKCLIGNSAILILFSLWREGFLDTRSFALAEKKLFPCSPLHCFAFWSQFFCYTSSLLLLSSSWRSCSALTQTKLTLNLCFPRPNFRLANARCDPVCSVNLPSVRVKAKRRGVGREQLGGALLARVLSGVI